MKNKSNVKRGFTLVELLIVVLIVGILVSVALPLYQNAVDKSRWAKLLSPSRAIANAEEAILMSNGTYTVNKEDLVVSLPNDGEYTYTLYTTENGDDGNFVRLESNKLEDVRLARYYAQDEAFSNQLYCEAKTTNARAKKLCGKLLQGQEFMNVDGGYKAYLLSGEVGQAACEAADRLWSTLSSTCYKDEQDRCTSNGMNMVGTGPDAFCGWSTGNGKTINEGGECRAVSSQDCKDSIVNNGGTCRSLSTALNGCYQSRINTGGQCIAEGDENGCRKVKLYGGKCIGSATSVCKEVEIYKDGICEGNAWRSCYGVEVHDGGKCVGKAELACTSSQFYAGGICEGWKSGACGGRSTFATGAVCIAYVDGACNGDYSQGGCCVADGGTCPEGTACQN